MKFNKIKFVFIFLIWIFVLISIELGGQIYFSILAGGNWSSLCKYVNSENVGYENTPHFSRNHTINSQGFRGERDYESFPKDSVHRILCVGGSTTFGEHCNDDETYPFYLNQTLGNNYEVINAGINGWNLRRIKLKLNTWINQTHPKTILISSCWNTTIPIEKAYKNDHLGSYSFFRSSFVFKSFDLLLSKFNLSVHTRKTMTLNENHEMHKKLIANEDIFNSYEKDLVEIIEYILSKKIAVTFILPPDSSGKSLEKSSLNISGQMMEVSQLMCEIREKSTERIFKVKNRFRNKIRVVDARNLFTDTEPSLVDDYFYDPIHLLGNGNKIYGQWIARELLKKD